MFINKHTLHDAERRDIIYSHDEDVYFDVVVSSETEYRWCYCERNMKRTNSINDISYDVSNVVASDQGIHLMLSVS